MTAHNSTSEGLALCATLLTPDEVTNQLEALGFILHFQMGAYQPSASNAYVAPLPAQYHYRHEADGCEIIFLAGRDKPEGGGYFPPHESCFWIYPGRSPMLYQRAAQTLSTKWTLLWHKLPIWASRPRSCSPDQSRIAL